MSHPHVSKLNRLHTVLSEVFLELLKGEPLVDANGTAIVDEQGKPIYLRPKANILKEAREFLKDNGIDREPLPGTGLPEMVKQLQKFDDEPLQIEVEEDQ